MDKYFLAFAENSFLICALVVSGVAFIGMIIALIVSNLNRKTSQDSSPTQSTKIEISDIFKKMFTMLVKMKLY